MTLADQLGVTDVATDLRTKLTTELETWFDPKRCATQTTKCFVYDDQIKSIIGQEASFGSDELNDHHFHYGYLIYAAAVVSANDSALADKIAPVVDLVVADIASAQASAAFPQYRNFDPYAGRSWASGSSPFADGNNQESSSEAVNAWNALALWEQVRGNTDLQTQASWMMSIEANAAKLYWTNTDLSEFPAFTHKIAALNWGGKRDYATWFSAEPGAMLGIQLIPMGSYSTYLAGDTDRIKANLAEGAPRRVRRPVRRVHGPVPGAGRPGRRPGTAGEPARGDRQRHHQVVRDGLRVLPGRHVRFLTERSRHLSSPTTQGLTPRRLDRQPAGRGVSGGASVAPV